MSSSLRTSIGLIVALLSPPVRGQLSTAGAQFWHEGSPGLVSSLQEEVHFGSALAAGDFDCDGFDDLAIGVPDDDDSGGALNRVGYVTVLYSSETGLVAAGHQLWDQQSLAAEEEESEDRFGETLVAGDFDADGCMDLVVGIPYEDIGTIVDAGAIQVIYGAPGGLTAAGNAFFRQGADGVQGAPQAGDTFGFSLAVGDFNSDGSDDLAIGLPFEDIESAPADDAGVVQILFGSEVSGLTGAGDVILARGSGLPGAPETDERLGYALAVGEFDGLPGADLAIAAPWGFVPPEDPDGGLVLVVMNVAGSSTVVEVSQETDGAPETAEDGEQFGVSLAAGDFDGDGFDELAVGVPGENLEDPTVLNAGAVSIFDLDGGEHTLWTQNDLPTHVAEEDDRFGSHLTTGDFDGDGVDDLVIGVSGEDAGALPDTGVVHVLYGEQETGLSAGRAQSLFEVLDTVESGDSFGSDLIAGQFTGHTGMDLAVSAYGESVGGFDGAGAVSIFHSIALFVDGFESGNTDRWSSTAP